MAVGGGEFERADGCEGGRGEREGGVGEGEVVALGVGAGLGGLVGGYREGAEGAGGGERCDGVEEGPGGDAGAGEEAVDGLRWVLVRPGMSDVMR